MLDRRHHTSHRNALGINVCDVYMKMLGYPTIYTGLKHVKYRTAPFPQRAATVKSQKPIDILRQNHQPLQTQALTFLNTLPPHTVRFTNSRTLLWRNFMPTQTNKAFDNLHSPLSTDSVTVFGCRPPELRFVMHQQQYLRWFVHFELRYNGRLVQPTWPKLLEACAALYNPDYPLVETTWVSALSKIVKIRCAAIDELLQYLLEARLTMFSIDTDEAYEIKGQLRNLFTTIKRAIDWVHHSKEPVGTTYSKAEQDTLHEINRRFVTGKPSDVLPTPWTNPVRPTQPHRFLLHMLLAHGAFVDEYDLFMGGTLESAFVKARLLNPEQRELSAQLLTQQYILKELRILPAGTPTFDRYAVTAQRVLMEFFLHGELYTDELPTVLYCRLAGSRNKAFNHHILRDAKGPNSDHPSPQASFVRL